MATRGGKNGANERTYKMPNRMQRQGRAKKKPQSLARAIAKKEGQNGIDSRSQSSSSEPLERELVSETVDNSIDSTASYDVKTITSLALGPVLLAMRKGWINQLTDASSAATLGYPYYAFVKLFQSFIAAMSGTAPILQGAPRWYWYLTQALTPKTLKYKTGRVSLKWNVPSGDATFVPDSAFTYIGGTAALYIPQFGGGEVDGFLSLLPPTPYTNDLGEVAITQLFQFYKSEGMNEIVSTYQTPCETTASAFAACSPEIGESENLTSGLVTTVYSELSIQMPILAKFAKYQPETYRGWQRIQVSGGSPCYTIPRMIEFDPAKPKTIYNQLAPQFKYYNFDEFFTVLSFIIGSALEQNAKTPLSGSLLPPCPLTSQQVQLLLRHTLMRRFYNHLIQDVSNSGAGAIAVVPFSAASNGLSTTTTNMMLPLLLTENIRASGRKSVQLGNSSIDYVPVLGRPFGLPQIGNFTYDTPDGSVNLYASLVGETPINIIDLSFPLATPTGFITTEGETIVSLCNQWNDWIKGLSSYLTPLGDPGLEKGLNAFSNILTTVHQKYVAAPPPLPAPVNGGMTRQSSRKKFIGLDPLVVKKVKVVPSNVVGSNYFAEVYPIVLTSTNVQQDPVLKYVKNMIAPVIIADGSLSTFSVTIAAQQIFRIEPYKVPMNNLPAIVGATTTGSQTLLSRMLQMALFDVKAPFSDESEVVLDLTEAAKQGRGGFFSNLAGMFAEDVIGIKGAKNIANTIGQVVGI